MIAQGTTPVNSKSTLIPHLRDARGQDKREIACLASLSLKPHPVDGDAGVLDLTRLEPKFVHHALPIRIRRKVKRVFVEFAITLDGTARNRARPVHHQPRPDYRAVTRAPFQEHRRHLHAAKSRLGIRGDLHAYAELAVLCCVKRHDALANVEVSLPVDPEVERTILDFKFAAAVRLPVPTSHGIGKLPLLH